MENQEQQNKKEVKKINVGFLLGWALGLLFSICGIVLLFIEFYQPLIGLLFLIQGAIFLPPVNELIKRKLHFTISGGLRIIIFVILVIIIGSISVPTNKESAIETTEESTVKTGEEGAVKEWVKVISLTANADKQSETFQLKGGQQKVLYSVLDSSSYGSGMCTIYVVKEGTDLMTEGGFPIVMIDGESTDETMMRKSKGNYYLDLKVVYASCAVEIYEYR